MDEIRQRERSIAKNIEETNWMAIHPTGTSYEIESQQSEYDIPYTSRQKFESPRKNEKD